MANNLNIRLYKREDRRKNEFYIGKLEVPGSLDLTNGVSFLIFISEEGVEELQIAPLKKERDNDSF